MKYIDIVLDETKVYACTLYKVISLQTFFVPTPLSARLLTFVPKVSSIKKKRLGNAKYNDYVISYYLLDYYW